MMVAVWTPEYRSDTPAWCREPSRTGNTLWCKHALSPADWWNIYSDGAGDGSGSLQDTLTAPGQSFLFRFNTDADLDGYSDRSQERLTTDRPTSPSLAGTDRRPAQHPERQPCRRAVALNNALDAHDVEAVMIALMTPAHRQQHCRWSTVSLPRNR
jgi:hypothetical protein